MLKALIFKIFVLSLGVLSSGCTVWEDGVRKSNDSNNLIATPPSYYSTPKARYLGVRYKDNLDRVVERITRNPQTATLQFANNISSVGGIGFYTHSATKSADERYLEVVLATPETFEVKGEFSEKVQQIFARYGTPLLEIVSGDGEIFQDREMSGYGLNFAWRNVVEGPNGNRVALERAILYFPKERVRHFLDHDIDQNDLLGKAVIYAVEEDGPLTLVSYQPKEPRPDVRRAIHEDNLASSVKAPDATHPARKSRTQAESPNPEEHDEVAAHPSAEGTASSESPAATPKALGLSSSVETLAPANVVSTADAPARVEVEAAPAADVPSDALPVGDNRPADPLASLNNEASPVAPQQPTVAAAAAKRLEALATGNGK